MEPREKSNGGGTFISASPVEIPNASPKYNPLILFLSLEKHFELKNLGGAFILASLTQKPEKPHFPVAFPEFPE